MRNYFEKDDRLVITEFTRYHRNLLYFYSPSEAISDYTYFKPKNKCPFNEISISLLIRILVSFLFNSIHKIDGHILAHKNSG